MFVYKFKTITPHLEKLGKQERANVLGKFTKANIKLNIGLDLA